MKEEWKDISGFDFVYQVSNYGNVKSLAKSWIAGNGSRQCKPDTIMKGGYNNCGYKQVALTKNGKSKTVLIHRLVALYWIGNPDNKPTVNHKDGNKHNNCVDNLEWMTYSENNCHAFNTGLRIPASGDNHHIRKRSDEFSLPLNKRGDHPVAKKVIDVNNGKTWGCIRDCSEETGIVYSTLVKRLSGEMVNNTPYKLINVEIITP